MVDKDSLLVEMYKENCVQGRHHEQQRTSISTFFAALAGAVLGLAGWDDRITASDAPAFLFICALGVFGAIFCAKQYERFSLHMERAREYRNAVDGRVADGLIHELKRAADAANDAKFPHLSSLRSNRFWVAMHLLIATLGLVLAAVALA